MWIPRRRRRRSVGFADSEYGLSFGYDTDSVPFLGGVDVTAIALAATLRECLLETSSTN